MSSARRSLCTVSSLSLAISAALLLSACAKQAGTVADSEQAPEPERKEIANRVEEARDAPVLDQLSATPKADKEDDELETIVVTGSRIRRVDFETGNPVQIIAPAMAPPAPPAPYPSSVAMATPAEPAKDRGAVAIQAQPAGASPLDPANREQYQERKDNDIKVVQEEPVSTFSIDVDTGSYSNVRRMLTQGYAPPADAVRAEEFINYFDYQLSPPKDRSKPFAVHTELAPAPWNNKHQLLMVGLKGYEIASSEIPAANLVFLIDTSGSMESPDKIGLLKQSFALMVPKLRAQDRVSIVVYAGSAGLILPPTAGDQHETILAALDRLSAGGSTNGAQGIQLAYDQARRAFIKNGVNRVILATDGDFNVGLVDTNALKTMVAEQRKSGVSLTTLGFGQGNYNDELSEQLADVGNGNHAYVDTLQEGHKVLVEEMSSTLFTIAKDVKIQIEFNPSVVAEYRLIGYENRLLAREDFNNDQVDAGEIGAGHDVTALYELALVGSGGEQVEPLRYGKAHSVRAPNDELAFLKLRYKAPDADNSQLLSFPIDAKSMQAKASGNLAFAAAVAAFADRLRGGGHIGTFSYSEIANLARQHLGRDDFGYRQELVGLVERAKALSGEASPSLSIAE